MFVRVVRVRAAKGVVHEYVRVVEAVRVVGKVRQRVVTHLGRLDVLRKVLPSLQRVLLGLLNVQSEEPPQVILHTATWGPLLVIAKLFDTLNLWRILDNLLGTPKDKNKVAWADRVLALLANRFIQPHSEHGLARWLETHYVCDRQSRRFLPEWHCQRRVKVTSRQLQHW